MSENQDALIIFFKKAALASDIRDRFLGLN